MAQTCLLLVKAWPPWLLEAALVSVRFRTFGSARPPSQMECALTCPIKSSSEDLLGVVTVEVLLSHHSRVIFNRKCSWWGLRFYETMHGGKGVILGQTTPTQISGQLGDVVRWVNYVTQRKVLWLHPFFTSGSSGALVLGCWFWLVEPLINHLLLNSSESCRGSRRYMMSWILWLMRGNDYKDPGIRTSSSSFQPSGVGVTLKLFFFSVREPSLWLSQHKLFVDQSADWICQREPPAWAGTTDKPNPDIIQCISSSSMAAGLRPPNPSPSVALTLISWSPYPSSRLLLSYSFPLRAQLLTRNDQVQG